MVVGAQDPQLPGVHGLGEESTHLPLPLHRGKAPKRAAPVRAGLPSRSGRQVDGGHR